MRIHLRFFLLLAMIASLRTVTGQESIPVGKLPTPQLQNLAEAGDPAAQNELGVRYLLGSDVEKNPVKAIPWFRKAAQQGYAKAYFNLGAAYYNGQGVAANDIDSCVWFNLAADAGDPRGQDAVERARQEQSHLRRLECEVTTGTAYVTGEANKPDYAQAMQWYLKAANAGDGIACEKIAYLYDRGLGVTQDKTESLKWLKRSADIGYAPAMYEIGRAYEIGDGVHQDLAKAKKFYEQSALYGQLDGLVALGAMYADGRGAKADQEKALAYYIVAANYGDSNGVRLANQLAAKLSPKEVTAAKQDARKFAATSKRPLGLVSK